jgi:hypothetical protein
MAEAEGGPASAEATAGLRASLEALTSPILGDTRLGLQRVSGVRNSIWPLRNVPCSCG